MATIGLDDKAIFGVARRIDCPEARQAYLQHVCGEDAAMLNRVTLLLISSDEESEFLEVPAVQLQRTFLNSEPPQVLGTQIGPYTLREQIGEGGMGIVYVAQQTEPVRRKVALKIIKPGMDSAEVIARFEAERQALAMMSHPNIARVLDGGTTDTGRPYFVMELVKGVSITKFCDERKLNVAERLELFTTVCQAVQHAHLKGIIHRDLKPGNILVELHDVTAVPKVIDFGIAKATDQQLGPAVYTGFSQLIGTPLYMSPEQAELSGLDIDTRSDVYSLGVLLYELLAGVTPFDESTLSSVGLDEMRRIIREDEPQRPSHKVSTLGNELMSTISDRRETDARQLSLSMQRELDWIVMKALEKDRTRRYESASALAADIQRYLDDEPVLACPPSVGYRLRKYVRRHKAFLTTAAFVFVSMIVGTSVAAWQAVVASGERNQAQQSEQKAELESAISKAVVEFLQTDLLGKANPDETPDPEVKLSTILDRAATGISDRFKEQPLVEAAIRDTIGQAYQSLGKYRKAEVHQTRAVQLAQAQRGAEDPLTLGYSSRAGWLNRQLGRYQEAEKLIRQTLESQQRILGQEHPQTLASMNRLASVYLDQGRHDEAEKLHEKTLATKRRTLGGEHSRTLQSMNNLANVYIAQARYTEAESLIRKTLDIRGRTLGEEHSETLGSMNNLANVYGDQGRHKLSEKLHRKTLAIRRRTLGEEHPDTLTSMNNLGHSCMVQARYTEAEAFFRKTLEIQQRTLGEEHPNTLSSMNNLSITVFRQKRYAEGQKVCRQVLEIRKRTLGEEHPLTLSSMHSLANCFYFQGHYEHAVELGRETFEIRKRVLGEQHSATLATQQNLAAACAMWSMTLTTATNQSEQDRERSLQLALDAVKLDPSHSYQWQVLGWAHYRLGHWQDTINAETKAASLQSNGGDVDQWLFLAMAHWQLGQREVASRYYAQSAAALVDSENEQRLSFLAEAEALIEIPASTGSDANQPQRIDSP
jgi:eukaryotic-like serine/threonine-protein kinase